MALFSPSVSYFAHSFPTRDPLNALGPEDCSAGLNQRGQFDFRASVDPAYTVDHFCRGTEARISL